MSTTEDIRQGADILFICFIIWEALTSHPQEDKSGESKGQGESGSPGHLSLF